MKKLSKPLILVLIFVVLFPLIVILPTLLSGKTFFGIDANVGVIKNISEGLWKMANEYWYNNYLLGFASGLVFNISIFLGKIIGYDKVALFDIFLYIVVSFVGMYIFLRNSGLTLWGSVFGATSISLTTMGVLSVFGGHINGSLGFILLTLGITKYIYSKDVDLIKLSVLVFIAGVSLGLAFADFQRTIYFGLVFGGYILFLTFTKFDSLLEFIKNKKNLVKYILIPLAIFIVFLAFSLNSILGMFGFVQMEQAGVKKDDPASKWKFLVQFSYPPEEILNFFIPGLFGYFSNDPNLPYWGRAAQDFDYEKTKQGMRNFRLGIDAYAGVFVLPFLLLAFLYFRNWNKDRKRHFIFWGIVAIIAFLLSIARYFPPLFWLLIQIPFFDKLRVPAKWMDIFIISVVIMSSFSFDSFVRNLGKTSKENRYALNVLLVYSGVLLLSYLIFSGLKAELTMYFTYSQQYEYSVAQKISENISNAIGTTFLFVFIGTVILYVLELISGKKGNETENESEFSVYDGILAVFVVMVFINMFIIVKPLFKEVDANKLYGENSIVKFMKEKTKEEQSRFVFYSSLANHYLTFLFPYHNLESIQSIAQSRLPQEYLNLISIINSFNFDVMAKYSTKYFITELPPSHPAILQITSLRYLTNISSSLYLSEDQPSFSHSVFVYEITNTLPRFFITPNYIKYNGNIEMFLMLPTDVLRNSVLLTNDITNFSPSQNLIYSISVIEYSGEYAKLKVSLSEKGFLVFNTYYHPKWECYVDGKKKEIFKANYLVQSVYLDTPGEHVIEFKFNSFSLFSIIQIILLVLFLGGLLWLGVYKFYFLDNKESKY